MKSNFLIFVMAVAVVSSAKYNLKSIAVDAPEKASNPNFRKLQEYNSRNVKDELKDNDRSDDCPVKAYFHAKNIDLIFAGMPKKEKACKDLWAKNGGLGGEKTMKIYADFDDIIVKAQETNPNKESCMTELDMFMAGSSDPELSKAENDAWKKEIIATIPKLLPKTYAFCSKIQQGKKGKIEGKPADNVSYRKLKEYNSRNIKDELKDNDSSDDCPVRAYFGKNLDLIFRGMPKKEKACKALWATNGGLGGEKTTKIYEDFDNMLVKAQESNPNKENCLQELELLMAGSSDPQLSKEENEARKKEILAVLPKLLPKTFELCSKMK